MFCAAIPATLAAGANVHARQRRQVDEARRIGEATRPKIPAGPTTLAAVALLITCSVIYHTQAGS